MFCHVKIRCLIRETGRFVFYFTTHKEIIAQIISPVTVKAMDLKNLGDFEVILLGG